MKHQRPPMTRTNSLYLIPKPENLPKYPVPFPDSCLLLYLDTQHMLPGTEAVHTSGYLLSMIPFYMLLLFVHLTNLYYPSGKSVTSSNNRICYSTCLSC